MIIKYEHIEYLSTLYIGLCQADEIAIFMKRIVINSKQSKCICTLCAGAQIICFSCKLQNIRNTSYSRNYIGQAVFLFAPIEVD